MTSRKDRIRLDVLIFERGLAGSREKAQAMILAGEVLVNGTAAAKAGQAVVRDARCYPRIGVETQRGDDVSGGLSTPVRRIEVKRSASICHSEHNVQFVIPSTTL